jgi:hypothetical protein
MTNWKTCDHEWGPHETIYEPNFHVAFGSKRVCKKCQTIEYESWCATRASGGTPKIRAPEGVVK